MAKKMSDKNKKPYVCDLRWDLDGPEHIKKLYLEGDDSKEGENFFYEALKEIDILGDASKSWKEFFNGCIKIFRKYGFVRVDK
jgi:hypothetical protein